MSVLWMLAALATLPGCATLKDNNLYSMWEARAYGAYEMPVPALTDPLASVSATLLNVSRTVSAQETKFISQYYSLQ
ncbi:MAG: hypothetical protein BWK73_07510 [Thiothrix lacustris]|uniref:DUF4136 domain-containing protein n=1 Tax=Thiothrix lacustris TaxID=525917 RepID=A0A1Y1QVY3_9GAMM|nr:MAG: hypothetical protein BWK73_07510 [Thiothrix lacustris]